MNEETEVQIRKLSKEIEDLKIYEVNYRLMNVPEKYEDKIKLAGDRAVNDAKMQLALRRMGRLIQDHVDFEGE